MKIKNILFISCLAVTYLVIGHNVMADENDILNFIDKQSEKQAKEKSENEKITMSKKELLSLLKKQDVNTKTNTKTKINSTTNKETETYEEEIKKIVKNIIEENNQTPAEKQEQIKKEQQEQERIAKQNKQKEEKDRNKEQNILNTIKNDNIDKTNDNNINDEQYESKTKKYGWHVNLGPTLYLNPYDEKILNAGLTLDLYYRSNLGIGLLLGVDGIWHNIISSNYRIWKSKTAGEFNKIREKYSILFKIGWIGYITENWSYQVYGLIGWTNSSMYIWNSIDGGDTSLKKSYFRGGFGFKVVYKRVYFNMHCIFGSPENIKYIDNEGRVRVFNEQKYNGTSYTQQEINVLFGFGVNFL